ncbi:sugar ABC transporter ATP-binding protein [Terrabacter aeriphilus]|uniref:Sugar ABC transporter ATP-binding protein n=1 Tax=Terrabacter aeriphilus TaxID=515662 RepID=A0ABP9JD59_9MICO
MSADGVPDVVSDDIVLRAVDVTKAYGGVRALKGVTFEAYRGKVNVLVGENGAGKSTLMKILAGAEQPSSGEILLDGRAVSVTSPRDAIAHGIGIIHQELSLFPNMSIAENLFAGRELRRGRFVDHAAQRRRSTEVLARLGQDLDPDTLVGDLPIGKQQLVEIARVLLEDVRILIMDEPTSALSNHEVDVLFTVMADLRRDDVTIIYISHKLDEFRRIGDYVTVLRDGSLVAHEAMTGTDTAWIVRQMVGQDPAALFARSAGEIGDVLLEVSDLTVTGPVRDLVSGVSLEVRAGEVVGIYGLMGAGRTELFEALMGTRPSTGEVSVRGRVVRESTVRARQAAGLALVPEDRQRDGLVQTMSVSDNVLLSTIGTLARQGLLARGLERSVASEKVRDLSIKIPGLGAPVTSLSGGNQQKVVLARALLTEPVVLLLDEPTRGVDVGAKSQIAEIMSDLAEAGYGVLFISSELAEVMAMADRVLVMARGRISAELSGDALTEEALVAASASDAVLSAATAGADILPTPATEVPA